MRGPNNCAVLQFVMGTIPYAVMAGQAKRDPATQSVARQRGPNEIEPPSTPSGRTQLKRLGALAGSIFAGATRRLGGRVALRLPGRDEQREREREPDSRDSSPVATGWGVALLGRIVVGLAVLSLCTLSLAHAVEPDEMLTDPAQEARARALTAELRCVVCQNQSVDDSDAPLAKDIRVLVRERILAGDTDQQVIDYIVARYGRFVLLKPPLSGDTVLLWFGPALLLVVGLTLAYFYVRRLNRGPDTPQPLSPAEEDAVKRIIEEPRA